MSRAHVRLAYPPCIKAAKQFPTNFIEPIWSSERIGKTSELVKLIKPALGAETPSREGLIDPQHFQGKRQDETIPAGLSQTKEFHRNGTCKRFTTAVAPCRAKAIKVLVYTIKCLQIPSTLGSSQ